MTIPPGILQAMFDHARRDFPREACGILGGADGTVSAHYPMTNTDASREHFTLAPQEQFAVVKQLRAAGLAMVAIYHSHPDSPARPSAEDIRLALTPGVVHVIISLQDPREPVLRAYRIDGAVVTEEPVVHGAGTRKE